VLAVWKMNRLRKQCAFTAVEVLTTVAILAILVGILLGVGRRLVTQAEEKLAQSTIDIIVLALEQYYTDSVPNDFPFEANVYIESPLFGFDENALRTVIELDRGAVPNDSTIIGSHDSKYASSEALFYFLYKTPNSRKIIDTITDIQITNQGSDGNPMQIEVPTGSIIDLVRFIDPWGTALRYTYTAGDTFPLIESAGANRDFDAAGDNITSK
jgi:prepilin-type N-terminal cleavage/methylation domain-containing protein